MPKDGAHITIEPRDKTIPEIDLGIVTGELTVRIGAGPLLTVELSDTPRLPEGVTLVVAGDGSSDYQPFDGERRAHLWLAATGSCRPRLAVKKGDRVIDVEVELSAVDVPTSGGKLEVAWNGSLQQQIERALRRLE